MNDPLTTAQRQPWIAAALSFFCPGLGQVYNGRLARGLVIFFLSFLVIPWLYGVIDAYFDARRQARVRLPRHTLRTALPESLEVALARAASDHGGAISVAEGVVATGRSFKDVANALDEMLKHGHIDIDNDADTGMVIYRFA